MTNMHDTKLQHAYFIEADICNRKVGYMAQGHRTKPLHNQKPKNTGNDAQFSPEGNRYRSSE